MPVMPLIGTDPFLLKQQPGQSVQPVFWGRISDSVSFSGNTQPSAEKTSSEYNPREYNMVQMLRGERVKIAWREFGNPNAKNVDFDKLAEQLAGKNCRVICPDVVGRGNSGWFRSPAKAMKYEFSTYVSQMQQLFRHLKLGDKNITWVGTSMGGIVGMKMAVLPDTPIRRLVLNDIGPRISADAVDYLSELFRDEEAAVFESVDEAVPYFKARMAGAGKLSKAAWQKLAEDSLRYDAKQGVYKLDYDPAITEGFRWGNRINLLVNPFHRAMIATFLSSDLRNIWQHVGVPVLLLHGEDSRVLDSITLQGMQKDRDNITVLDFPGVGHAPALVSTQEVKAIRDWIKANS